MTLEKIFEFYNEIELGRNSICNKCIRLNTKNNTNLSKPISIWKVGENYKTDKHKILFVGKVARGLKTETEENELFIDSSKLGNDFLINKSWPYWSYTRDIIKNVYGNIEIGKENIAFSNLIKCNDSMTTDNTTCYTKTFCIGELKVIWEEINILKPKRIIFYTHRGYDDFISDFRPTNNFKDVENQKFSIKIGAKKMPWWNRIFYDDNDMFVTEFLRIGHPERKKKIEFVKKVSDWIKKPIPNILYS